MNQNATSMPTCSLSIKVHKGDRQSSKEVSHKRSWAEADRETNPSKSSRHMLKANLFINIICFLDP
jgi:hypothetical protein